MVFPVDLEGKPANILAVIKTCGFAHKKGTVFIPFWQQGYNNTQRVLPLVVLVHVDSIGRHWVMNSIDEVIDEVQSCLQEIWHHGHGTDEFNEY